MWRIQKIKFITWNIPYIQSWPKISAPLVNMIKEGCENESALLILLIFYLKNSQKSNLSLDIKNLKWEKISLWNKCFSQIHIGHNYWHLYTIHNFEHSRVIMNMKLSSHGFLFHRNINRRENKAQIPLIIHRNKKKQNIFLMCSKR